MEHCDHCIENTMCTLQTYLLCKCTLPPRSNLSCKNFVYLFSWILHPASFFCNIGPLFSLRSFLRMDVGDSSRNFCSFQYLRYSLSLSSFFRAS